MSRYLDNFSYAHRLSRLNYGAQVALLIAFLCGINFFAFRHYTRVDHTTDRRYSLSPETVAYVRQLTQPVEIIVTIPKNSPQAEVRNFYEDVSHLLREYQYAARAAGDSRIAVEFVDILQQRKRAEEIAAQYDIQHENSIVVVCQERFKKILALDLYDSKTHAFKGEETFTAALLEVTNPTRPKVYFLTGHGEMSPDSTDPTHGLSVAKSFLAQRNFEMGVLDLSRAPAIPADADLIVIPGPRASLLPQEVDLLKRYLNEQNGRLVVFLNPFYHSGLDGLFFEWGLLCDDRVIVDVSGDQVPGGDWIIRRFVPHPTTQILIDSEVTLLVGLSRPVGLDLGAPIDEQRTVVSLLYTSDRSWATPVSLSEEPKKTFNPQTDIKGPVSIAALAERNIASTLGMRVPGGKLFVFGNSDWVANNRFSVLGNSIFFNNIVQWALDRDSFLHIPPRGSREFQLAFSRKEIILMGVNLLFVPMAVAILGVLVFIRRRY